MTVPWLERPVLNRHRVRHLKPREITCADIGLPSARVLLLRLRRLCRSWGIEGDFDDALLKWTAENYGINDSTGIEADEIIDELATARRCLSEKHRGPQEAIEHIERAMTAAHRA